MVVGVAGVVVEDVTVVVEDVKVAVVVVVSKGLYQTVEPDSVDNIVVGSNGAGGSQGICPGAEQSIAA